MVAIELLVGTVVMTQADKHRRFRALHERPVMAPEALPREVDTVYVGLNPAHARASVGDLASLAGRPLSFFYL